MGNYTLDTLPNRNPMSSTVPIPPYAPGMDTTTINSLMAEMHPEEGRAVPQGAETGCADWLKVFGIRCEAATNCPKVATDAPDGCQRHDRIRRADTRNVSAIGWGVGWVPIGPAKLNGASDETPKGGCVELRRARRPPAATRCNAMHRVTPAPGGCGLGRFPFPTPSPSAAPAARCRVTPVSDVGSSTAPHNWPRFDDRQGAGPVGPRTSLRSFRTRTARPPTSGVLRQS